MKTFKQFLREQKSDIIQGQLDKHGIPNAVILNDKNPSLKESFLDWKYSGPSISDQTEIGDRLHENQNNEEYNSSNPEHFAIKKYTSESRDLNKKLYNDHVKGKTPSKQSNLDNGLKRHKLADDLDVYSGTHFNPGKIAEQHSNNIIHLPAYTSTSLDRGTAARFAQPDSTGVIKHVIHFHLKQGQHGRYVGYLMHGKDAAHYSKQMSENPHEREFILPRNTTIKIHHKPDIHKNDDGNNVHVWHAHVVDEENK